MNLCSDKHDEVCYQSRSCPACVELEAKKGVMEDLQIANKAVTELENRIADLQQEIDNLTREPVINEVRKANQNEPIP